MKIGELSKKTGVPVQTIRYYQSIKLIPKPKTAESGYREFNDEYVNTLKFIVEAKKNSFTLKEIKFLFNNKNCKTVGKAINQKIKFLERQISNSIKIKTKLETLLAACPKCTADCTILKIFKK